MTDLVIAEDDVKLVKSLEDVALPLKAAAVPDKGTMCTFVQGEGLQVAADDARAWGLLVTKDGASRVGTIVRKGLVYLGDALDAMDVNDPVYVSETNAGILADAGGVGIDPIGYVEAGYGVSGGVTGIQKLLRLDL